MKLKEQIENYLNGQLSEKERKAFELAIQKDAVLAKEVRIVQEVNEAIATEKKFQAYQKKIEALGQQYFKTPATTEKNATIRSLPKQNRKKLWLVAASVLILIVSSILIWNVLKTETVNSSELFASNYEPYNVGQRGAIENLTDLETEALKAYNTESYESVIPLLQELIANNPNDEVAILQLGNAYIATKQTAKAIETFQQISNLSINYQVAQWYLALTYLQANQVEDAKETLKQLVRLGERTYPAKAKILLDEM